MLDGVQQLGKLCNLPCGCWLLEDLACGVKLSSVHPFSTGHIRSETLLP
ncbi:mCG61661 [Mus musculus]|nr:mCG61661 [Mus musculus]